jgi:UDP-N-acetyl-D-glucosamine dehydrogenase
VRESPAIDIMKLLEGKGGVITYCDPHVPRLREAGFDLASTPFDAAALRDYDCLVITAAHSAFDYRAIVDSGVPIVDSRNALKEFRAANIRKI